MSVTNDSNFTGSMAELVVAFRFNKIGKVCRVTKLGDKWPAFDFYVEFDHNGKTYYFFVQVKSTFHGIIGDNSEQKLLVQLSKKDYVKIARHVGPTYLFGVDMSPDANKDENTMPPAYVQIIRGEAYNISRIAATDDFIFNNLNLQKLIDEVTTYWDLISNKEGYTSNFEKPWT